MPGSNDDAEPERRLHSTTNDVAFCRLESIGAPIVKSYAAQWLAYARPCQRFARRLATTPA
jgi:hypothetical protein